MARYKRRRTCPARRGPIVPVGGAWDGCLPAGYTPKAAQRLKLTLFTSCIPMPKASPSPAAADMPASYEAALLELEQLLVQMEAGELALDQLLGGYRRGAELLKFCRDKLEAVEDQIKVLDQGVLKTWTPE